MGVDRWRWNDAWIFTAVVIADRLERDRAADATLPVVGAGLADVLSAAAFLHDAVPQREEVQAAVRRLAGAGLITVKGDDFAVAAAGERLWRTRPLSGLSAAVGKLQATLNRFTHPGDMAWSLDEPTYAAALRDYHARAVDGG